jgi:hypothetical protein
MPKNDDPILAIISLILLPLAAAVGMIIDRIIAMIAEIADVIWLCCVKIPMEISDFGDKLQLFQYALEVIHNLTTQPLVQGIQQSISPFSGILSIGVFWLLGILVVYYFGEFALDILSLIIRELKL